MDQIFKFVVKDDSGCWLWLGRTDDGYGRIGSPKKLVHRLVYEYYCGPIPDGLVCDHLCRVRNCCNPNHIELVTNKENSLRGEGVGAKNSKKTHCPQDHEYTIENTYLDKLGKRYCRTCQKIRKRQAYLARCVRAQDMG